MVLVVLPRERQPAEQLGLFADSVVAEHRDDGAVRALGGVDADVAGEGRLRSLLLVVRNHPLLVLVDRGPALHDHPVQLLLGGELAGADDPLAVVLGLDVIGFRAVHLDLVLDEPFIQEVHLVAARLRGVAPLAEHLLERDDDAAGVVLELALEVAEACAGGADIDAGSVGARAHRKDRFFHLLVVDVLGLLDDDQVERFRFRVARLTDGEDVDLAGQLAIRSVHADRLGVPLLGDLQFPLRVELGLEAHRIQVGKLELQAVEVGGGLFDLRSENTDPERAAEVAAEGNEQEFGGVDNDRGLAGLAGELDRDLARFPSGRGLHGLHDRLGDPPLVFVVLSFVPPPDRFIEEPGQFHGRRFRSRACRSSGRSDPPRSCPRHRQCRGSCRACRWRRRSPCRASRAAGRRRR